MKSRIIVQKVGDSKQCSLVCSLTETVAEINRVIEARERAIMDEAKEDIGASTPKEARHGLLLRHRACLVQGSDGRQYPVLDYKLQKMSRHCDFHN